MSTLYLAWSGLIRFKPVYWWNTSSISSPFSYHIRFLIKMSLFRGIWFYTAGNQEFLFRFFDENFWLKKWMKRYWTLSGNQSETKKMFRWELCLHPVNHKMVKFTKNQEKRSISDMILPYFPVYIAKYIPKLGIQIAKLYPDGAVQQRLLTNQIQPISTSDWWTN